MTITPNHVAADALVRPSEQSSERSFVKSVPVTFG